MQHEAGMDASVSGINLAPLRGKLAEEKGWSDADLDQLERQYKRYLNLKMRHPEEDLVPTQFIDEMWHAHILDTRAYAEDCQRVFGCFLHHYPYLGVGGEQEKAKLDDAFTRTSTLWRAAYGEDYQQLLLPQRKGAMLRVARGMLAWAAPSRCAGHKCHAPSNCACRSPGACK
jgi:hypothetical protein